MQRPVPSVKRQPEVHLAVVLQVRRRGGGVERQRRAVAVQQHVAHPQRQVLLLERHAGVPGGGHDPAPVRVGPEDRRLHQRALGDRLGDLLRASASVRQPSTSMVMRWFGPLGVGGDLAGQVGADAVDRRRGTSARSCPASGGPVPFASRNTVSFVLVWPSTVMQLNVVVGGAPSGSVCRSAGATGGVGQDEPEHGGHVRADHRRPLGEAGDGVAPPAVSSRVATLMRVSVVRMAWAASVSASRPGCGGGDRLRDAGFENRHRQRPADHAGARDEHLLGRTAEVARPPVRPSARRRRGPARRCRRWRCRSRSRSARASARGRRARLTCTGAAQTRFWVNTPAAAAGRVGDDDGEVAAVRFGAQAAHDAGVPEPAGQVPVAHVGRVAGRIEISTRLG